MQYNEKKNFFKKGKKTKSKEIPKVKNTTIETQKSMNKEKSYDDQIEGRNAVLELLESDKDINKIYITSLPKNLSGSKLINGYFLLLGLISSN